jgi:hypothetical protein
MWHALMECDLHFVHFHAHPSVSTQPPRAYSDASVTLNCHAGGVYGNLRRLRGGSESMSRSLSPPYTIHASSRALSLTACRGRSLRLETLPATEVVGFPNHRSEKPQAPVAERGKSRSRLHTQEEAMGSRTRTSYEWHTLAVLEHALREVHLALKAHDPYRDWEKDDPDLTRALAEKLMDLVDAGVKDSNELRDKALKSLSLERASCLRPGASSLKARWRRRGAGEGHAVGSVFEL